MNIQAKSTLIIIATLLLGMVIGALITGAVIKHTAAPPQEPPFPRRFIHAYERILGPDAENIDTIRTILDRHSARFQELMDKHRADAGNLMDSLRAELDPVLTPEQKERLEEYQRRFQERRWHPRPPGKGRGGMPDAP